jgi:hypothetical protein
MEIEQFIAKSRVTLETRKIIQARASILFPSLPKKIKKQKLKKQRKKQNLKLPTSLSLSLLAYKMKI